MAKRVNEQVRFSLDEAQARGACLNSYSELAHKDLELRLGRGELVRPMPGLYARKDYWETLPPTQRTMHKMRGLARQRPWWVFAGTSAALAYGLPVSHGLLDVIEVASRNGSRTFCDGGVRGLYICEEEADGLFHDGLLLTTPLRTALDCARRLPFREAVAILDGALHAGLFSKEELIAYLGHHRRGVRGIGRARETAAFADGRSESGGESMARTAMWELGFAAPDLQVPMTDPVDGGTYRVDFLWRLADGRLIAGELDGGEKYVNREMTAGRSTLEVLRDERRRESRITATCDAVVRFTPQDVACPWRLGSILEAFGVPKDHDPLVETSPAEALCDGQVPLECYGV